MKTTKKEFAFRYIEDFKEQCHFEIGAKIADPIFLLFSFLQMLTRDSKGLTEEQLNEYRASFNHFDKSHRRSLDAKEFRNCLISIGYNIQDTTQVRTGPM